MICWGAGQRALMLFWAAIDHTNAPWLSTTSLLSLDIFMMTMMMMATMMTVMMVVVMMMMMINFMNVKMINDHTDAEGLGITTRQSSIIMNAMIVLLILRKINFWRCKFFSYHPPLLCETVLAVNYMLVTRFQLNANNKYFLYTNIYMNMQKKDRNYHDYNNKIYDMNRITNMNRNTKRNELTYKYICYA